MKKYFPVRKYKREPSRSGWVECRDYSLRTWEISHQGTTVWLRVEDHGYYAKVSWRSRRLPSCRFTLTLEAPQARKIVRSWGNIPLLRPDWKEIFKQLRLSLTLGLHPQSRMVTERMLGLDKSKSKIHYSTRISSKSEI